MVCFLHLQSYVGYGLSVDLNLINGILLGIPIISLTKITEDTSMWLEWLNEQEGLLCYELKFKIFLVSPYSYCHNFINESK